MKISHSKTISAVCSFLLFATAITLIVLVVTNAFSGTAKPGDGSIGDNIGKGCTAAIVIISSLFAVITQTIAGLFSLGSVFSHKRKGSVYTSNVFCILFCVIAIIVYIFTLYAYLDIANNSSMAKFITLTLIGGFSADLFAIASCIIAMVVKGKNLRKEESIESNEQLSSFVIGQAGDEFESAGDEFEKSDEGDLSKPNDQV